MSSPIIGVDSSTSVVEVSKLLSNPNHQLSKLKRIAVFEDGKIVGVVERAQIYEAASHADPTVTVGSIKEKGFKTIREEEFAYQALRTLVLNDLRFLVALNKEGKPVGYVSRSDILKALKKKIEDESIVE